MTRIDSFCYSPQTFYQEQNPMNVSLTPELDRFVAKRVASGRYTSASEVVREGLRLLEQQERLRAAELGAFNKELSARIVLLDRGESINPASVSRELKARSQARRRQTA
jgi:antitoxin ParD1/3/4